MRGDRKYYNMSSLTRVLLLVVGFVSMGIVHFADKENAFISVVTNLVWPFCFLACSRCSRSFGEFALTAAVFISGLVIKFMGFFSQLIMSVAVFTVMGILCSLVFFVDWKFQKRRERKGFGYGFLATLMFPITWMAVFSLTYFLKFGIVFRLSCFFFDCKVISQCLSVIGGYGFDFLLLWTESVIVYSLFCDPSGRIDARTANVFLTVVLMWAVVFTYGCIRLALASNDDEPKTIKVAYGTGLYAGNFINFIDTEYDSNFEAFESLVRQAHEGEASLLATNEEAYQVSFDQYPAFIKIARQRSRQYRLHMLLAFDIYDPDGQRKGSNRIVWIDDRGNVLCEYEKYSLIPLIEASEYESTLTELPNFTTRIDGNEVKVCCAICYDSNFSNFICTMDDDTDILILPSWDWTGVSETHYRIAGDVGIENGVSVLKPTYDGISYCGDLYGNIIKVNNTNETGYVDAQFVDLPIEGRTTVYGAIGEYLHWVCLILFAILLFI